MLALAFISLLACGIGLSDNKSATAFPGAEYMGGSYISQVSQGSQKLTNKLPKAIANAILRDASKLSQLAIGDLKITQVTQKTFGNGCKFKFGEICTQEFNPIEGWEVVVQVRKQSWTYHVNKSGSQIVLDPKVSKSGSVGSSV
ncbi:MAG: hypothetical protein DSM106950_39540 [Stigonema ocellatum SAG 48.90 = DSM 106950]|nr:hypothetical protein [Stigonema ocellatum SAG 48.90 = DSM 106950]